MVTIVLAMSERAAKALERKITDTLPQPGDADLLTLAENELRSQLSNATATPKQTETTVAQDVAAQMAAAGAAAIEVGQDWATNQPIVEVG